MGTISQVLKAWWHQTTKSKAASMETGRNEISSGSRVDQMRRGKAAVCAKASYSEERSAGKLHAVICKGGHWVTGVSTLII